MWILWLTFHLDIFKGVLIFWNLYVVLDDFQSCHICFDYSFNDVFNVLTGNYTVNQILNKIRKFKKNIKVKYVNAPIMNQLSYHVDDSKMKNYGFKNKGK